MGFGSGADVTPGGVCSGELRVWSQACGGRRCTFLKFIRAWRQSYARRGLNKFKHMRILCGTDMIAKATGHREDGRLKRGYVGLVAAAALIRCTECTKIPVSLSCQRSGSRHWAAKVSSLMGYSDPPRSRPAIDIAVLRGCSVYPTRTPDSIKTRQIRLPLLK